MNEPRRLFISFSGGETSAYMTHMLLSGGIVPPEPYGEVLVAFANTGQENEQTLQFVDLCDIVFGFRTTWVEAVVHPNARISPTHRVVSFSSASRNGEPFESVIGKYGIPNSRFKHCTRSLKLHPMFSFLRSIGWVRGSYDTAVGIRTDECDRISIDALENRIVYPLISWKPTTKPQINTWWRNQPFRLELKGYQGNCKGCWKKSMRKHMTLMRENPEIFDFPERMEREYGLIGPEFRKDPPPAADYKRTFFRKNLSTVDLRIACLNLPDTFTPAPDDADVYVEFDPDLDVGAGCEESCEVFADEDMTHE